MSDDLGFECAICETALKEHERLFTLEMCTERERDGAYDVSSSVALLTVCEPCSVNHNLDAQIQNKTVTVVETVRVVKKLQVSKPKKIIAIHNRYDCTICDQRIPNSSEILTTSSGYEQWDNGSIIPEDHSLHMVACINCAEDMNLEALVKHAVDSLIIECKKQTI